MAGKTTILEGKFALKGLTETSTFNAFGRDWNCATLTEDDAKFLASKNFEMIEAVSIKEEKKK